MRIRLMLLFISLAIASSTAVQHETRQDGGSETYIVKGTIIALETDGLIRQGQVDTAKTWTTQLSTQNLSKRRSRQIYLVELILQNGEKIQAIVRRDVSPIAEESGLIVYVVSKVLQSDGKSVPPH